MSLTDIELSFPMLLRGVNFDQASDEDFNYNCLAFAVGDKSNWWDPPGRYGHYWPPGFSEDATVETVARIIALHGYVVEAERGATPKTDSVAIYAKAGEWTHFAKFACGRWTS